VAQVIQDKMLLDGSAANCRIVPFAHAAYRAVRIFLRWKYTASLGSLGSSLQRCPYCLSHGDGPARSFGLAKRIEDGARGKVDVLNANSKHFVWSQPGVQNGLRDVS
jgi:hypothetical protein